MSEVTLKQIVEALIMASEEPLAIEKLHKILGPNNNELEINILKDIVNELVDDYAGHGVELKEVASGWRFQIKHDLSSWVGKLYEERPPRYSRAFLEILALIAYRQPITRAEIEAIRGVAVSSNIIKTLLEHEWVRIIGHKEVPGRPALFATTKKFLDHFNLKHLDELPPLMEFTESIELGIAFADGEDEVATDPILLEVDDNSKNVEEINTDNQVDDSSSEDSLGDDENPEELALKEHDDFASAEGINDDNQVDNNLSETPLEVDKDLDDLEITDNDKQSYDDANDSSLEVDEDSDEIELTDSDKI
ncbi:MAG: SMC-Scp complex subunit ScpB [Gammaproteobacteria bacterium]|nr:SMC-Scp complex subunit ScpB [Gammaproteobacteria bacterium]